MKEVHEYVYGVSLKNKDTGEIHLQKFAIGKLPKQKQMCLYLITENGVVPMAYFTSEAAARLLVHFLDKPTNNKEMK